MRRPLTLFFALTLGCGAAPTAPEAAPRAYRPFSNASPWNTPIGTSPRVHEESAALVATFADMGGVHELGMNVTPWGIPVFHADRSTPLVAVRRTIDHWGTGFDARVTYVPIPADAVPATEDDAHMSIIDVERGIGWDFWRATREADGTFTCGVCSLVDLNGDGVRPPLDENRENHDAFGSRACGFPLHAGLITVEEVALGEIEHALILALPQIRARYFMPPASTGHPLVPQINAEQGVPCGAHIQLDPELDVASLGLSREGVIVARALQQYGAYVGDFSGSVSLNAEGSPSAVEAWGERMRTNVMARVPMTSLRVLAWDRLREGQY